MNRKRTIGLTALLVVGAHAIGLSVVVLLTGGTLLGLAGPSAAQHSTPAHKTDTKKTTKHEEVKYKAHCGMIYSAADAKKYHYICPMDHKPLTKITTSTGTKHK